MFEDQVTLEELQLEECFYFFDNVWVVREKSRASTISRDISNGIKTIELNNSTLVERV